MTTTQTSIPASSVQAPSDVREANNRKFRNSSSAAEPCFLCGRPLTAKAIENGWMIHMTTGGDIVPQDHNPHGDWSDSQGCFPVGSECAKRIPTGLKFKYSR